MPSKPPSPALHVILRKEREIPDQIKSFNAKNIDKISNAEMYSHKDFNNDHKKDLIILFVEKDEYDYESVKVKKIVNNMHWELYKCWILKSM